MRHDLASDEQRAWEKACPAELTTDVIWNLDVYRCALFLQHLARRDCGAMLAERPGSALADQLTRAAGSVGANLGEGYSRSTRADRLRFLAYSLGSTRECIAWYSAARDVLPERVVEERLRLLVRIRSLLLGLIRSLRTKEVTGAAFEP
jgi:four helix bundle protein